MSLGLAPHAELPMSALENGVDFVVTGVDALASVTLNNKTARDLGLVVSQVSSWQDAPAQEQQTTSLVGVAGSVRTDDRPRVSPLELRIVGTIRAADAAQARAKRDRILNVLRATPVTVVLPDSLTRYTVAELALVRLEPVGASFRQRDFPCEISLKALDPYRYDLFDQAPSGGAGVQARCPLGNAPVRPVITIVGAAVNPLITFRDYLGNVVATLGLTVALVAGDVLVIDFVTGAIKKNGVGAEGLISSGDFFVIDPAIHADYDAVSWPTLASSAGFMTARYRRTWT